MNLVVALITPLFSLVVDTLEVDRCKPPKEVDEVGESIIQLMTRKQLKQIRGDTVGYWWDNTGYYLYNYEDVRYIKDHVERGGCEPFHSEYAKQIIREYVYFKARRERVCFDSLVQFWIEWSRCKREFSKMSEYKGNYVPVSLAECMVVLDTLWDDQTRNKFLHDDFVGFDKDLLFMGLRNDWGLGDFTRLHHYFDQLEIKDSEASLALILRCYKKRIVGAQVDFEEEIKLTRLEIARTTNPSIEDYPMGARYMVPLGSSYISPKDEQETYVLVCYYKNQRTKDIWVYHGVFGWIDISKKQYKLRNTLGQRKWINYIYSIEPSD